MDMDVNTGLCGERPGADFLSRGMALLLPSTVIIKSCLLSHNIFVKIMTQQEITYDKIPIIERSTEVGCSSILSHCVPLIPESFSSNF
jgi:hypothetical protein